MLPIIPYWSSDSPEKYVLSTRNKYVGMGTLAAELSVGAFNFVWLVAGRPTAAQYWSDPTIATRHSTAWVALAHDKPINGWLPLHQASTMTMKQFYESLTPGKMVALDRMASFPVIAAMRSALQQDT